MTETLDLSTEELRYLVNFERMVLELSGRFMNLAPSSIDAEIDHALETIGRFDRVDRSYLFRLSDDGQRLSNTHEWCAEGIAPMMHRLQDFPADRFAPALDPLLRGDILYVERVSDLPEELAAFRYELEIEGVQSLLNVPLRCSGKLWGFVGFDAVRAAKTWGKEAIRLLRVVGEIVAGAIAREQTTADLNRRVAMEELIGRISSRFINVPSSGLEWEIETAIRRIGEFTGVDRSYVFQISDDGATMDNTFEWCAPGIEPHIDRLSALPVACFEYSLTRMRRGRVFHVPWVCDLPDEAAAEREEFEREGIQTLITVPMTAAGAMIGFLGFDAVRRPKIWSQDDIRLLKLVGEVLASAVEKMRAGKRLRESLREKEILLREIHHRVKNNMQVVQSLLYLQANAIRDRVDPVALEAFRQSRDRIKTMAAIHDRLYRSADLASIDFDDYLHALVADLERSYGVVGRVRVGVGGGKVRLGIDQAIPCGLIVNELVSNSLKHAFPGKRHGRVEVRLRPVESRRLQLSVSDNGVGLPRAHSLTNASTLGLQLVSDLVAQLSGEVQLVRQQGTRIRIQFPEAQR
jgi:two-component sensor histidine kinase